MCGPQAVCSRLDGNDEGRGRQTESLNEARRVVIYYRCPLGRGRFEKRIQFVGPNGPKVDYCRRFAPHLTVSLWSTP